MKPYTFKFVLIAFIVLNIATHSISQSTSPPPKSSYHDFDFWIGSWDVYKYGTDTIVGLSEIKPILNHKVIEENYQSNQNSYKGTSNNIYNGQKQRWEQYWVDNSGLALHIVGGLEDEKMVMTNCENQNCNKIIRTPNKDKTVRQEWLQSKDDGLNWVKVFDGHYKPKENKSSILPVLRTLSNYPNIRDFTISSNEKEAYITVQNPNEESRIICKITNMNGIWSQPKPASFSGKYKDLEPYFSTDNLRLYFSSNRPNKFEKENYDIFYVEREHLDSTWSSAINVGSPINTNQDEFYPAIADSGNLYFTSVRAGTKGKDDIFLSRFKNKEYTEPISLDSTINTLGYEFNSFIAPDESFLIFSGYNRSDGLGSGDLYISYRDSNNSWSKAENLGNQINSKYMDYSPFVNVSNGNLYFTSKRNKLDDNEKRSNFQLEQEIMKYENGASRIYKTKLKLK